MDATQVILTIAGSVIGSGAVFGFVQFLIQRKDKQKEDAEGKKFQALRDEFKLGLQAREDKGRERYEEHREAILKMSEDHRHDFETLLKAIEKLTENDTKTTECIEEIQKYNKFMGDEIMGLAHDKLVYLTDRYQERGAITLKEKATLEAIYKPYHEGLNGNGDGQVGYEFAMKLPVVTDSKAREMDIALGYSTQENRRIAQ